MKTISKESSYTHRVAVLASSNMLLQLLGFIYRMMLADLAGTEALGLLSLTMQIYHIVVSVCISGLNVAVVAITARLYASMDMQGISALLRCAVRVYLLLFASMAAPLIIMRTQICTKLLGADAPLITLDFLLMCIFMTGIENILKSTHIGMHRIKNTAYSELLEQAARFIFVGILLRSYANNLSSFSVTLIIAGMLASEIFSVSFLLISYSKCFCRGSAHRKAESRNMRPILKEFIKVLVPSATTSISCTVFASCASLLLPGKLVQAGYTRLEALSTIGTVTSIASPVITLPFALIGALSTVLMPAISEKAEREDYLSMNKLIEKSFSATSATALPITAALVPISSILSELLFGSAPEALVFNLLAIKAAIIYYQVVSVGVLNGIMKQKKVLLYAVLGEVSQLILMLALTGNKNLHIYGYLIAMIVGEGMRLAFNLIEIRRATGISPIRLSVVGRTVFMVAVMYMYSKFFAAQIELHGSKLIVIAAAALIMLYFLLNGLLKSMRTLKTHTLKGRAH